MIIDLKRIVAYICPFCSGISKRKLDIFQFSGGASLNLVCHTEGCHETCVTVKPRKEKYHIEIECPLCGDNHNFVVSQKTFWEKDLLTYQCPLSAMRIFYIGTHDKVEQALTSDAELLEEMSEQFAEEDDELNLIYEILECLQQLAGSGKIYCCCGNEHVSMNLDGEQILLTCSRCNRKKTIEISDETLAMLLNAEALVLGN